MAQPLEYLEPHLGAFVTLVALAEWVVDTLDLVESAAGTRVLWVKSAAGTLVLLVKLAARIPFVLLVKLEVVVERVVV